MRIAFAADGADKNANISNVGARAPFFLIFDNTQLIEVIKNPFAIGGGGAGWSVAYMLSEKHVEIFVAGNIGVNMQSALSKYGIKYVQKTGSVIDALNELIK